MAYGDEEDAVQECAFDLDLMELGGDGGEDVCTTEDLLACSG